MTIVQLAAHRWWTGSADPVIRLVSGLSARGHRVLLGVVRGDRFEARCREAGIPAARVTWTPGIADTARFAPNGDGRTIRDEFGLGDAPVVVMVSRLAANRGHEALLAGFKALLARRPQARLLLVGKGE